MAKKLDAGIFSSVQNDSITENTNSTSKDFFVSRREQAQAVARGQRIKRPSYRIPPDVCKIREDHDRNYTALNAENCSDLIEGIKVNGQLIPAIVRRLDNDEKYQYELIVGARRHWVASYLGVELLIEIRELSEEEVFLLSDEENRNRKDITDYERALKYSRALQTHFRTQTQMSQRMGVSNAWLSRFLDIANLPQEIIDSYSDVAEIKESHARELKALLKDRIKKQRILDAVTQLQAPLNGQQLIKQLKEAASGRGQQKRKKEQVVLDSDEEKAIAIVTKNSSSKLGLEFSKSDITNLDHFLQIATTAYEKYIKE